MNVDKLIERLKHYQEHGVFDDTLADKSALCDEIDHAIITLTTRFAKLVHQAMGGEHER